MKTIKCALPILFLTALTTASPVTAEIVEWDELKLIIEINATDGDVGFHALADAGAWRWFRIDDPDGKKILAMRATGSLRDQGVTESFFESAEPLCEPDEEEPDDLVVTFAEFIMRFPEGDYLFRANNNEGDRVKGTTELTYNLPAAPDISMTEDSEQPIDEVIIEWAPGTDLGEKCHDQSLVDDGIIADPASVEIVGWEVVVEPDDEEAADPLRKFSVQLPPEQTSVLVPVEFLERFFGEDIDEFKFEVGAIEESGNQTFSEGTFSINVNDDSG